MLIAVKIDQRKISMEVEFLPPPVSITERIRKLRPGECLLFTGVSPSVIRVTASQVKSEFKRRRYKTKKEDGGVRVWRIK
jgi:hypothetical protein